MLQAAIVGGGRIADMHAPGYRDNPWCRLVAVCDLREEVARARAAEWGCAFWTTSYEELLARQEIDLVEINVPHHLHEEMTIAAAAAGKHVSVQKPMAPTPAACDAMIRACAAAGVTLRVYENFIFYPPYRRARELVEAGAIGEPLNIRLRIGAAAGGWRVPLRTWLWRLAEAARGGGGPTLYDDGYHKFSVALWFFGSVASVAAQVERSLGLVDTPASVVWRHRSGPTGMLDATLSPNLHLPSLYYGCDELVVVTGTKGKLLIPGCTARPYPEDPPLLLVTRGGTRAFEDVSRDWMSSFVACTRHLGAALAAGEPVELSGRRGKEILHMALAAYESARLGGAALCPDAIQ